MTPIAAWLQKIGLEKYAPVFEENEITLDVLPHLTQADVDGLGLPIGPRRKLMVEIQALAAAAAPPAPVRPRAQPAKPIEAGRPGSQTGSQSTAERRQLTVMFCDLVGSTALAAEMDPEELRDLMQAYRKACGDVVARYDGHVAQYLGDGLMVYFGWPAAHEDDAERGVRAALEMLGAVRDLKASRPLSVRIGLATGPVVVGEGSQFENTEARLAVGEAPNLAARLQNLARPGEIVIAPATRRLVRDSFTLTDLGAHQVKGISGPVQVWRVDDVRRTEARFDAAHAGRALSGLVGREEELSLLLRRWEQACAGHGQVVAIGGEAGIGKSRLSLVLRERVPEAHASLRYQCSPYHLDSALYPFIEQLEHAAGFGRDDTPDGKLDRIEKLLAADAVPVPEAAPLLGALLSLPTTRYAPLQLSRQKQKERTLEVLAARVETLARRGPLLMVFEDLHWIDPTSQELLDALIPRLRSLPVLLLATHRPEYAPKWAGQASVTSILLARLERGNVAQLVGGVTGGRALPPEVLEEILSHTDGVPLFVEELTKSVLESGLLRDEGDRYTLDAPLASLAIPTSLRDSLAARLDRLGPVKEIAQIGACIGREFTYEFLAHAAAGFPEPLDQALARLIEAELISCRGTPPFSTYTFKHALVQDAAYDLLLKSRRQQMHATLARVLEEHFAAQVAARPESLAHHHTQAGDLAAAIPLWRRAGALAIERVALQEAVAHLRKALGLTDQLPPSPDRDQMELTIREQLNAAWAGLRGWAAADIGTNTDAILRLARAQRHTQSLLLGLWWMWTNTITQGRIADSLPWAERLVAEGAAAEDADLRLFGPSALMVSKFFLGDVAEAQRQADVVLAQYDPRSAERWIQLTGHDLRTFVGVYSCQWIWMSGHPDRATAVSDGSAVHARAIGHAFNLVWALTFGGYAFAYRREPDAFLARVREAERLARDQGIAFIHQVSVPQAEGVAELLSGRPREAIPLLRRGIENWTRVGGNVRIPFLKSVLAQALAAQGDLAGGLQVIDECIEQIARPQFQERIWLPEVLRVKGTILALQGRRDEAEAHLREAVACARRQGTRSWELRAATSLAEFLAARGERDAARAVLEPVVAWFTEGPGTPDLTDARAHLASLTA